MAEGIDRFEVIPYSLAFREEYVTSKGGLARRELILLRIFGQDGAVGLGEAVPLSLRGGASTGTVAADLERGMANLLTGFPGDRIETGFSPAGALPGISAPARVAIQMALADLGARRAGIPLFRQLATDSEPRAIELNATLGADDPQSVAREARQWAEAGFRTFKVKVGDGGDATRVRALRAELGPEAAIRLDANGSWTIEEALSRVDDLNDLDVELVEEPVSGLELMARFREASEIRVVADESVSTPEDARRARELGSCDVVTVKLSKIGSLDPSLDGYLPTYLSSALDGPVGIAAALHVAMTPSARAGSIYAQGLATSRLFRETVAVGPPEWLTEPITRPPESPGLGIELDEAALDAARL